MIEERLFEVIDPVLKAAGSVAEEGEDYREPPLDVLRYYRRPVRLHWFPLLGRGLSVVAVVRQPVDISLSTVDYRKFLTRLALAVNGRFPVSERQRGVVLGLTCVVLTPEPIGPEDDAILGTVLGSLPRSRAVPLGVIRLNLGQEALSFALASGPEGHFPEPEALADVLTPLFRRFVPFVAF